MKTKSFSTLATAIIAAVLLNGCTSVNVGGSASVGTYYYMQGELKVAENATVDKCWDAIQGAMKDLQFNVTSQKKDALQGRLIARTALDKKVEINLTRVSETVSEIRIHVDTLGDQALSITIVQSIEKRLKD